MPIRRGMGGLSSGAGGNLFDRPGFFDYAEIAALVLDSDLLLKTASETYGIYLGHGDTSSASQHYTATIPALSADGEMVITTATQTLTNKTYIDPVLTTILDANGNEQLILAPVSSAVNYLQITNSAASNPPILKALGTDTNIDLRLEPKGSGKVVITGDVDIQGTSTTVNSTTLDVDDKNITMGSVGTPTNTTANGGGITLKGATDKTIIWDSSNTNWTSSEHWNLVSGKIFKINNVSMLSSTTLGASVINSSLTSTGALNSGSITSGFGSIDTGASNITTTGTITGGQLTVDDITINGDTISSTGAINFAATTNLDFGDKSVLNIGNLTVDSIHGDNNAIAIGDNSDDAVSLYRVNALTAIGDLDIGAHDFRAASLTADGLTAARVLYAGTNGLITGEAGFTYDASGNSLQVPTLVATNINAFTLGGKLTAGSNEIEGSAFDIDGGAIDGTTLGGASAVTINGASIGTGLTWGAAQNFGSYALTNVNIDSGTANLLTSFGIKQAATAYEVQLAVGSTTLTANRAVAIDPKNAARTLTIGGDLTLSGDLITSGDDSVTLTTSAATNVTLPTTGTLATLAGNETFTNKTLTTPAISSISNSGTITLPTGTDTLVGRATTDTLTNKTISGSSNTFSNIGNSSLSNSAVTIGGTATSLGGTITALTALTDLDLTAGNKTIFDTVGANTLTMGASNTTISIPGNLTVGGTTTTVNSTTVTIADPVFNLGGTSAPSSDDNKDRGISFRWHNGSAAKIGFFGYDDSTGKFTFIPDATLNSEVVSGTAGTIVATTFEGALTGNASTATTAAAWTTARTLSFTGDVTGSGSVNGGSDVATALTIASNAVQAAMVHEDTISGRTELTSGNVDTANDFMLVWDATDQVLKKAKPGSLGISGQAVGSGNELQYNNSNNFAGAANVQIKNAALALKEMSAPNQTSGFGALYAGTDNELYYKDDGGNATKITSAGSLAGGGAFKGVKAYSTSANTSISNNSATTLTGWTESYDVGAMHDGSTNTERFTFGQTGYFLVNIQQEWEADSAGYREMAVIYRDTSGSSNNVILRDRILAPSAQATAVSGGSTVVYVDDIADYLTVQLYQNSGAALNAVGNNDDSTFITISRFDMATSASGTSSGTAGHIQFSDGSGAFSSDNNAIFWDATNNRLGVNTGSPSYSIDTTASGTVRAATFTGALAGNATTATTLATARTIGGTSFDGSANIAVALSATATALATARTIGGVSFDGSANINLPGVNATGNQDTSGNAATATTATLASTVTVVDSTDTSSFIAMFDSATGSLAAKTDAGLTYNAGTGMLTATGFTGPLTGNVTGNASGTAATVTGAAQSAITSLGTLTTLQVDNLNVNGNTITATTGAVNITPAAGSAIVLDGTINVDAGVVTGATSITSTAFVGALTGNASTATALAATGNIAATGDIAWNVDFSGSNATAAATIQTNAVQAAMVHEDVISGRTELTSGVATDADFLLLWDATDSAYKKVKPDNLGVSGTAVGSANEIQYNNSNSFAGASNAEIRNNSLALKEQATPSAVSGFGMLYAKTDNELYYRNDTDSEVKLTSDGTLAGGVFKGVKAYLNGDLAVATATSTTLGTGGGGTWTEVFDVGAFHHASTNTERFTFGATGYFIINIQQEWAADAAGYREMAVTHVDTSNSNATNVILRDRVLAPSNQATAVSGSSTLFYVDDAADYLTVQLYQNSGGNLNAEGGADDSTFITISGLDMAVQGSGPSNPLSSGTAGHVQFADGSSGFNSDSNAFFWDSGNNRLGIGTASPAYSVDTTASGTIRTGTLTATEVTATTLDIGGTNITSTAAELNLLDGGTSVGSSITIVDADGFVINDAGTMKTIPASDIKTYASTALDDVATGDAAVTLATSTGNITIDAQGNDTDIIFKGTDNSSDITMLTLDGSEAGNATFNSRIFVPAGSAASPSISRTDDTNCGLYFPNTDQMAIATDGVMNFMFAGTNFHADGDVYAFSTVTGSDIALKKNITIMDNALDKVSALRGVVFDWKKESRGSSAGLIAQDVEKVLPELVTDIDNLNVEGTYKGLNYNGIIGLLVESIKELKNEITELKNASR